MSGLLQNSGPEDPPDQPDEPSARESAHEVSRGLREHLHARLELLGLECEEARHAVTQKGALGILLAAAAFFAYVLLLVGLVALLGRWFDSLGSSFGWEFATLLAGISHGLVALLALFRLKRKSGPPLFEYTRAEFHKDREWLKSNPSNNENERSS